MAKVLRWTGYAFGSLLLLILLAVAYIWFVSSQKLSARVAAQTETLVRPTPAQLADGARQLRILGCVSCHGEGLRGKTMFDDPMVARMHAPNIPLVASQATDQQLAQALRQGIGRDGRALYVMPSAQYSRLDDGEVAALIGAIRALPRQGEQMAPVSIGPLGRVGIVTGKFKSQPELVEEFRANLPADLGPQFARGRHIAMTNCAECHGAAFGGQEMPAGDKAPNLSIVGSYDLPAFARLMRTGTAPGNRKLGLMRTVAVNDFRHLTDAEIAALHAYLVERASRAP